MQKNILRTLEWGLNSVALKAAQKYIQDSKESA